MNSTTSPLELRDIHLPEPISWWPLAPGWWLLLAAIALIIAAVFFYRHYQKRQALKKTVAAEFKKLCEQHQKDNDPLLLIQSLSIFLRRTCISFYPRSDVASLTGEAWLQFLDDSMGSSKHQTLFNSEYGQLLVTAPYLSSKTQLDINSDKLIQLCQSWLQTQPNKNHGKTGSAT